MTDFHYRTLVWLSYRLAASFALGLPLVLMVWASIKKEKSICRLLSIYLKIASLLPISLLLLTNQRPIGYLTLFISPFLLLGSIWFWIDINEEIMSFPSFRALSLTVKVWRWALTGYGFLLGFISIISLSCLESLEGAKCNYLIEGPRSLHFIIEKIFNFLFGANWSPAVAAFVGYVALIAYSIGLIQWIIIRFPKQGRIAGDI